MFFNGTLARHRTVGPQADLTLTSSRWLHGCTGSDRDLERFKSQLGAARLEDMAVRRFVRSRRDLDFETLEEVPWSLGKKLLDACLKK